MADLDTTQRAPLLLEDDSPVDPRQYTAVSSNAGVASVADSGGYQLAAYGNAAGTATITVTRLSDGATATVDVSVDAAEGFTVHLGTAVPK